MRAPLPPGHPLHDEQFREWVLERARSTGSYEMVCDRGFLDNMARGMAFSQGDSQQRRFSDRVSSFDDEAAAGGIMLLWREYQAEQGQGSSGSR